MAISAEGIWGLCKKAFKWMAIMLAVLILFNVGIFFTLQTQWGQAQLTKAVAYYAGKKLQTEVGIGQIRLEGLHQLDIYHLMLKDKGKNTLLSLDSLRIKLNLKEIFSKKIRIDEVYLAGIDAGIYRQSNDTGFNFQFISDAFSSGDTSASTTQSSWGIDVKKIGLQRIHFQWKDAHNQDTFLVGLKKLQLDFSKFDINKLAFGTDKFMLDGLDTKISIGPSQKPESPDKDTASLSFSIDAQSILLTQTHIDYKDDGIALTTQAPLLTVKGLQYDQASLTAVVKELILKENTTNLAFTSTVSNTTAVPDNKATTPKTFSLQLDTVSLEKNHVVVNDKTAKVKAKNEFDPAHIDLDNINIQAAGIKYKADYYEASVRHISLKEKSGFELIALKGTGFFGANDFSLRDVNIATPHNNIQGDIKMHYASLMDLMKKPAQTTIDLHIAPTLIRLDDWAAFIPSLRKEKFTKSLLTKNINFDLNANGTLDALNITSYHIATEGNKLSGSMQLQHPTDIKRIYAGLQINEFSTSRKKLQQLLPKDLLSNEIWAYVPETIQAKGKISGDPDDVQTNIIIQTNDGNIGVKGYAKHLSDTKHADYDVLVSTDGFALDKYLANPQLGNVSGDISVKGRGFDPEEANMDFTANIHESELNGYAYKRIAIKGSDRKGVIDASIQSEDPNLDLTADLGLTLGKKLSDIHVIAGIENIDLFAIGLTSDSIHFAGNIDIQFPRFDSTQLEGKAFITDLLVSYNNIPYLLDTIQLLADVKQDTQLISLTSPFLDADLKGQFSLQAIQPTLQAIISNYIETKEELTPFERPLFAELKGNIHVPDSLAPLVPGLKKVAPFPFYAKMDTRQNQFTYGLRIPYVEYKDYTIDSLFIGLIQDSAKDNIRKAFYVAQVSDVQAPSFTLPLTRLAGTIDKGIISSRFFIIDSNGTNKYLLPVTFVNHPERPYIFLQDTIILNTTRWNVNADNRIYLNLENPEGSQIKLTYGNEEIEIKSHEENKTGFPLTLNIKKFELETLAGMITTDTVLLEGEVNASFAMDRFAPLTFNGDIKIDSLKVFGNHFGNLHANALSNENGDYVLNDLSLTGAGNNVVAKGHTDSSFSNIDFTLAMKPLNLSPIEPFVKTYIDSLKGGIGGDLHVFGNLKNPNVEGELHVENTSLIARQTGTYINLQQGGIHINEYDVTFDDILFTDSAGNHGSITGDINFKANEPFHYDLKLEASNFTISGYKRYEEQMIAGPLKTDLLFKIKGDLAGANIDGNAKVLDGSKVKYVYESSVSEKNGDGLIEFFDPLHPETLDSIAIKAKQKKSQKFKLTVNSYINITPKSELTVVIDEMAGDQLQVRGSTNLNFTMAPDGDMQLVGNYEVESGTYNLSIAGLLRKEFAIQKGSTIDWAGDILKAKTNLKAAYNVKTDASELLQGKETVSGAGKQKLNFIVYLMIKGELLKPAISFQLDMADKDQDAFDGVVYTRLKQVNTIPSELNKQVMGLLALNSFIADNPFSSIGGSGNFETEAYATAGRLLTQELNNFLGNNIKNVDIDIGLDIRDDYSSGKAQRRSDLKVGFAKSFANNRLSIYVGNTFALENHNQDYDLLKGLAGDVSLEYMVTTDGRYRLKGFRATKDDITFNGTVIETGVSFAVVVEFNKFKNAFRSKKKRAKQREQRKNGMNT